MSAPSRWTSRAGALLEVSAAFAAMHLAFRAFQKLTPWGRVEVSAGVNWSPGVAMLAVAFALSWMRRRRGALAVLGPGKLASVASAAFVCLVALGACGALALACGGSLGRPPLAPREALTITAVNLSAAPLALWTLRRGERSQASIPRALTWTLLCAVPAVFVAVSLARGESPGHALIALTGLLLGAGYGEELFFRGYVQTRLDDAFGTRWRLCGVSYGPGLLFAAALFGLIHALNPYDYFSGRGSLDGWQALAAGSTLHLGFLRARTGGVLAPAIAHGYADLLTRILLGPAASL